LIKQTECSDAINVPHRCKGNNKDMELAVHRTEAQSRRVDEEMTFVKIVRNVSGQIPAELRLCPDQYVGTISE
jgi:hypothetical protein